MKTIDLTNIPDKRVETWTTSLKFKYDLIHYFQNIEGSEDFVCVEVGAWRGYSTHILAQLFGEVYSLEFDSNSVNLSKEFNKKYDNIIYRNINVYKDDWGTPTINVSFIDCIHDYPHVLKDIENSIKRATNELYLVFDDYGLIQEVKRAIDDFIHSKTNIEVTYIGEPKGSDCRPGKIMNDWEGVIVKITL
jgi:hypothetical protein